MDEYEKDRAQKETEFFNSVKDQFDAFGQEFSFKYIELVNLLLYPNFITLLFIILTNLIFIK